LWKAFWLVGLLGQVISLFAIAAVSFFVLRFLLAPLAIYALSVVAFLAAAVFASVSVWRCAPNAKLPQFGALARVIVAFYAVGWVVLFLRVNSMGSGS
jgi:predicted permease